MPTVGTSTATTPLERPSHAFIDLDPATGYLYAHFKSSTANRFDTFRSTDVGSTWASFATVTRTAVTEMSGIWIDDAGGMIWAYRTNESSQDRIYLRRLDTVAATWSAECLIANPGNGGAPGAFLTGIDFAVARGGKNLCVIIAVGLDTSGAPGTTGVNVYGAQVKADGTLVANNAVVGTARSLYELEATGRCTPSVDIEHNGDGKTSATPHAWIAFGRARVRVVKCTWGGAGWTVGTPVNVATPPAVQESVSGRWDGTRFLTAYPSSGNKVTVLERNKANTTSTLHVTPVHTQALVRHCAVDYETSGNFRIWAVGTSTNDLYWIDYVRATGLYGAWTIYSATDILGTTANQYSVRRGMAGDYQYDVLTVAVTTGVITNGQVLLNYSPTAPTWRFSAGLFTDGGAADTAATLQLVWDFHDPSPIDSSTAYAVSRQIGAGALAYWRASDSTWQVAEVQNVISTSVLALASGWGAGTDPNYVYKVKVWDSTNLPSPYSAGLTIVPSVKVDPTIVTPTASQVLTTASVTMTWTAAEETAYRVTLITGGVTVYNSGYITGTDLTFTPPTVLANGTSWTITLQTKNNEGLPSTFLGRNFSISYIVPMTPTTVATPVPASGWVSVAITNPTPSGGAPVLDHQDLYHRVVGDTSNGTLVASGLASGASFNDWQIPSGIPYEFRVQAFGINGTAVFGAWTG